MEPGARIGYLVKSFPVVSETFILNEVRAMEADQLPLTIFALKPPPRTVAHAAVGELSSPVRTAPWRHPLDWPRLALAHTRLLWADHRSYTTALGREVGRYLGRLWRQPTRDNATIVRKRLRRFAWAGWVASQAWRAGVVHLHAHYAGEPLRVAHIVRRLAGIPYSFTAHAKDLYLAPKTRLARRLSSVRFAVGCHRHGVESMRALLAEDEKSKVHFIRHGIDAALFARARRPEPRAGGQHRILAVGRLTAKKGFEHLIDACALLAGRQLDFSCDIVGDGALRTALEQQIEDSGLAARVRIHGFVPQQELPGWYQRATVLALPSKTLADGNRDGVPNVLIEAMASGTPVVASDTAGIPEWIDHGLTGLLVPASEPGALADALARVLTSPELGGRLAAAAGERVATLDYRRCNRPLVKLFRRALSRRTVEALARAGAEAWQPGGLAAKAGKRLGLEPRQEPAIEESIRRAVQPGIEANAWRPDLARLAGRRLWDEAIKANRLKQLLPLLIAGAESRRVLDLGSGRGGLTVALQARGIDVTGVDLRFRNCAVTRRRGQRYGLETRTLTAIGEQLPFATASFDAVACLEVLEHVGDPQALLREIRRVVKPEGRCVLTVINRWAPFDPHYHLWGINFLPRRLANAYIRLRGRSKRSYRDHQRLDDMHYYSYRAFVRLAAEHGFTVRPEVRAKGPLHRWLRRLSLELSLGFNSLTVVLEPVAANRR